MEPEKPEIDLERLNISPDLKAAIRKGIEDGLFVLPEPFRIHIDPLCDRAYLERAEEGLMTERPPASLKAVAKVSFINHRIVRPARPEALPPVPIELARCMSCDQLTDDCNCKPICPICGKDLIYWIAGRKYSCSDVDCVNGHGMVDWGNLKENE